MTTLYILRGVPGSGKSTLAKLISQSLGDCPHYEADMFFIDKDGNYNWSADRLYQAHKWCFEKTKAALEDGKDCIVSNTFVKKRDLNKYKKMAVEVGATPYVVVVQNDFGNIHNVPPEVVQRMRDEFEY